MGNSCKTVSEYRNSCDKDTILEKNDNIPGNGLFVKSNVACIVDLIGINSYSIRNIVVQHIT